MSKSIVSHSVNTTSHIAKELVSKISQGTVIALYGDLGSGKTTFTKELANALGVARPVQSPTFVLMREYALTQRGLSMLYHLDLYRLTSYESDELGLLELFQDSSALVVIEWADKIKDMLPERRIDITFTYRDEDSRTIVIDDRRKQ